MCVHINAVMLIKHLNVNVITVLKGFLVKIGNNNYVPSDYYEVCKGIYFESIFNCKIINLI